MSCLAEGTIPHIPLTSQDSPVAQGAGSRPSRPQRVLACVLCQQRKVKCDRKFPCVNCLKVRVQCVPATQTPRVPRRRNVERELLNRIRTYEDLLRRHQIDFKPLVSEFSSSSVETKHEERGARQSSVEDDPDHEDMGDDPKRTKDFWDAINKGFTDTDDTDDLFQGGFREGLVQRAWNDYYSDSEGLLFGTQNITMDLATLHPETAHIFRLWQVYLDNVNPLLKVTHTPTLQARIVEAVGNIANISRDLEALLFAIYFIAVLSLDDVDCMTMFGSERSDLIVRHQFACEQALLRAGFMRTSNRDCLAAFLMYTIGARPSTDPRVLAAMLGTLVRVLQINGYQTESVNAACDPFEAEMRRRLWWATVMYDTRMTQLAGNNTTLLIPAWNCKVPSNVNDADLTPGMADLPITHNRPTEATFVVIRSEMGDFLRFADFHLDFANPMLKQRKKRANPEDEANEITDLEELMIEKYLQYCRKENPLDMQTLMYTRGYLATCKLIKFFATRAEPGVRLTDAQQDAGLQSALDMISSDTELMVSPLTGGYFWFRDFYFPFLAYLQISQELRRRPFCALSTTAWELMSANYESRMSKFEKFGPNTFLDLFGKLLRGAWAVREAATPAGESPMPTPKIVMMLEEMTSTRTNSAYTPEQDLVTQFNALGSVAAAPDLPTSMDTTFHGSQTFGGYADFPNSQTMAAQSAVLGFDIFDGIMAPMSWSSPNWGMNT